MDVRNASGWTPLMYAAHYGHYNVIRVLLQHGANSSLQEPEGGKTGLMLAASNGHTRCIETLVCQGSADIAQRDFAGNCASFYATHYGHGGNKIIARLLAIRQLPSHPAPHSPPSCLHSSANTSGYKSASGQMPFGQHSPPSSVLYGDHNDLHQHQNSQQSISMMMMNASTSSNSAANRSSSRNSPKSTPRAIFKSPGAYNQRRSSNGSCSPTAINSAVHNLPSLEVNGMAPDCNSISMLDLNGNSAYVSAKSNDATSFDESDSSTQQASNAVRLAAEDMINASVQSSGPFSPSQFLTGQLDRRSPFCSTPQPSITSNAPGFTVDNGTSASVSPTPADSNTSTASNTSNQLGLDAGLSNATGPTSFSLHCSQSSGRPIANDIMIPSQDLLERTQHFDFVMDVEAFGVRRSNSLVNQNNAQPSSPTAGLNSRRARPFESLNTSFTSQQTTGQLDTSNSNRSTVRNFANMPGSADLPINVVSMLQNLRLDQYSPLFRDRRVSLLVFLQMTDTELLAIGVSDRTHISQLLDEQNRIRQLLFGPSREEVQRVRHQVNVLNGEQKALQNTFRRLLDQVSRVCEQLDQVDDQIASLNRNTNELRSMI